MLDVSEQDDRWRVFYIKATTAQVTHEASLENPDTYIEQWRRQFRCFNDVPQKTREAVSYLAMCANGEKIKGIGQRVSEKTYWLDSTPDVLKEYD